MGNESNRSLRIRTTVGKETADSEACQYVSVQLNQTYDTFDILSLSLSQSDAYKLHNSNYGVIVGRVLANNGFGIPNAKISVFISYDSDESDEAINYIYPFGSVMGKDNEDITYNLLPDEPVNDCHKAVGTFPNKRYLLDNDVLLEVFDKYYKYTVRSNNSGDYMICGVPSGTHTLHMDLDISDCGVLSQRPRDFVYKGYTIEQFENPNQFKDEQPLTSLSQIFTQNQSVYVRPFWGNEGQGETIGITRADIDVNFKFEPTCIFMGCVVSDAASNGISKKCIPADNMGLMGELTTGEGKIEMIRKTMGGAVEEFQIKGNDLIDGNGVWCYQIPMNLDYIMTDEYGNIVPTNDPSRGIPTRARVRFRMGLNDFDDNSDNYFRGKVLVPHNPQIIDNWKNSVAKKISVIPDTSINSVGNVSTAEKVDGAKYENYDYAFGTKTQEESFRDLYWNNVYTVKSFIPRIQKSRSWRNNRFTGIKECNYSGQNNPMPYNNIRIRFSFMFVVMCALIKAYIFILKFINWFKRMYLDLLHFFNLMVTGEQETEFGKKKRFLIIYEQAKSLTYNVLDSELCPDIENWYFCPVLIFGYTYTYNYYTKQVNEWRQKYENKNDAYVSLNENTLINIGDFSGANNEYSYDKKSIDYSNKGNKGTESNYHCLTYKLDYVISCIEMNLAKEYKLIRFDFYNDWINGMVYIPRWVREYKVKQLRSLDENGNKKVKIKKKGCFDNDGYKRGTGTRYYTQQCGIGYKIENNGTIKGNDDFGCVGSVNRQNCHKKDGIRRIGIFNAKSGGLIHEETTMKNQYVYYCKPCQFISYGDSNDIKKVILYANDIVLLGSVNENNKYGIPQAFKYLTKSSYVMPTNLALTNMDTDGPAYINTESYCASGLTQATNNFTGQMNANNSSSDNYYTYGTADTQSNGINYTDDIYPVTEAAGISWNYTGPGQVDLGNESEYRPGGHFLGLTCTNVQTNYKSCFNLQRICEFGTTLSQRRMEDTNIGESSYGSVTAVTRYFSPTGFISNDEINNPSFRAMFATMNINRLLSDSYVISRSQYFKKYCADDDTNYKQYSYLYMRGNGFDGAFSSYVNESKSNYMANYNTRLSGITADINLISYIANPSDANLDLGESANTYTMTNEYPISDYVLFRFGIQKWDFDYVKRRFLLNNGSAYYLPTYENSYYFYFGLKDGSTALDQFYAQFYSDCGTVQKNYKSSIIATTICDDTNLCTKCSISIITTNMEAPIKIDFYKHNSLVKTITIEDDSKIITPNISYDTYTIKAEDANGNTAETSVEYKNSILDKYSVIETQDFTFNATKGGHWTDEECYAVSYSADTETCGYVSLECLDTDDEGYLIWSEKYNNFFYTNELFNDYSPCDYFPSELSEKIVSGTSCSGATLMLTSIITNDSCGQENGNLSIFLWGTGAYKIYHVIACDDGEGSTTLNFTHIDDIYLNDTSKYNLYLCDKRFSYYADDANDTISGLTYENKAAIMTDYSGYTDFCYIVKHSLFKQTYISATTTIPIYGVNKDGSGSNIILFGQPENLSSVYTGKSFDECYMFSDQYPTDYAGYDLSIDNIIRPTYGQQGSVRNSATTFCVNSIDTVNKQVVTYLSNIDVTGITIGSPTIISVKDDVAVSNEGWIVEHFSAGTVDSFYYCVGNDNNKLVVLGSPTITDTEKTNYSAYRTISLPIFYRPFSTKIYTYLYSDSNGYKARYEGDIYNGITAEYNGQIGFSGVTIDDKSVDIFGSFNNDFYGLSANNANYDNRIISFGKLLSAETYTCSSTTKIVYSIFSVKEQQPESLSALNITAATRTKRVADVLSENVVLDKGTSAYTYDFTSIEPGTHYYYSSVNYTAFTSQTIEDFIGTLSNDLAGTSSGVTVYPTYFYGVYTDSEDEYSEGTYKTTILKKII